MKRLLKNLLNILRIFVLGFIILFAIVMFLNKVNPARYFDDFMNWFINLEIMRWCGYLLFGWIVLKATGLFND